MAKGKGAGPGRPTDYTEELGILICEIHASGVNLPDVCEEPGMPALRTIYLWERTHAEFMQRLVRAREEFALAKIDQLAKRVEDTARDEMRDDQGRRDLVAVKRDELCAKFYQWLAEKRLRKTYGNQITQEITGADGAPLIPSISVTIEPPKS